jgi:myo-inositol-1(or 4)-monophosphatase
MTEINSQGIEDLSRFALDVIRRSGDEAMKFYGKGDTRVKFDEELITRSENHLADFFKGELEANFPEHQIFSAIPKHEEYTHDQKRYLWIFDPLDGVANYQAGIPIWGMSLALIENFWPVFGAVYMPATGDLFHARAGAEAYLNDRKIQISKKENVNDESIMFIYSRFHHEFHSSFPGKILNMGSTAAHMCYIAMGRAEVAVTSHESYRGLAAAHIIVEAAGGKVFKIAGEDFHLGDYLDGQKIEEPLMVLAPGILSQVRACIRKER